MKKKSRIVALSVLGLGSLLIISFLSFWAGKRYIHSSERKDHSFEVISLISLVQSEIERAETAQRGYVLTESQRFLEPYQVSVDQAESHLAELQKMISDNPSQKQRLEEISALAKDKFLSLYHPIQLVQSNRSQEAIALIREAHGQVLMEELRKKFEVLTNTEQGLLEIRSKDAHNEFARTTLLVSLTLVLAFALLSKVALSLRAEIIRRSKVEKSLTAAENQARSASEMKSMFLANMSHEIRTPLNGIIGLSEILSQTELKEEQREHLNLLQVSSRHLLSLINQVLDLSKIESGKFQLDEQHFEFTELIGNVNSILKPLAEAKGLEIKTIVDESVPPYLIADSLRLQQVLLNLLGNAIKFSLKGTVELHCSLGELKDSEAKLNFSVKDQGIGISEKAKEQLFEAFTQAYLSTTRQFGGTGLGLSISKHLIEMMAGEIRVKSQEGLGTTFDFDVRLKSSKFAVFDSAYPKAKSAVPVVAGSVLVAEDNLINQKVISTMLLRLGLKVRVVPDGVLALDALREEKFDLVLMDGHMPLLDGYETTKKIRNGDAGVQNSQIPVIAFSANAMKEDVDKALECGMNDSIAKPVHYADFLFKIQKWLKPSRPKVDFQRLQSLNVYNAELFQDHLELFHKSTPGELSLMQSAYYSGNYSEVQATSHRLKSICVHVGATGLASLCAELESKALSLDHQSVGDLIEKIHQEHYEVTKELLSYAAA